MSFNKTGNPGVDDLTALIESIVERILGGNAGKTMTSWAATSPRISSRIYYQHNSDPQSNNQALGGLQRLGGVMSAIGTLQNTAHLAGAGAAGTGAARITSESSSIFGTLGAKISAAASIISFLVGLFGGGEEIDRWDRPTFTPVKPSGYKPFTVDRGEEDLYYMPESFYFRTGWTGSRSLVVRIGNNQFDDHIRESLTNSYATQLQRGLVF